jgi:hypothetical protein
VPVTLNQDILEGKDLQMLGRAWQVSLDVSASGTSSLIFQTNNTDYRGSTIFVAYVVCETNTGVAFPANVSFSFGVVGNDFLGGAALSLGGQLSGCIAYNQQTAGGTFSLISYGPQVLFQAVNSSTATTAVLGQFSAYGWTVA